MSWLCTRFGLLSITPSLLLAFSACGDSSNGSAAPCATNCTGADAGMSLPGQGGLGAGNTAADGGVQGAGGGTVSGNLPCAIKKLVSDRCQMCHSDPTNFSATMPLTTLAQFHAPAKSDPTKTYVASAKTRINAAASGAGHMPPPTSPQLTSQELTTLNAWLDQGAPGSTESCAVSGADAGTAMSSNDAGAGDAGAGDAGAMSMSNLDCYKLLAHNGDLKTPYKVGVATDAYFNFVFAAPWQGTACATG